MTVPASTPDHMAPSSDASAPTFHAAVVAFKRQMLATALAATAGNRTEAARALGLQRTYLHRLIRELGVTSPSGERRPS
jgi:Nif-specific regulatory protein